MHELTTTRAALLALAFAAEVAMLACLGAAGAALGGTTATSWSLAATLVVAASVVWGLWCAPRAARRLATRARWAVKLALVSAAAALVVLSGADGTWRVAAALTWVALVATLPLDTDPPDVSR